MKSSLPGCLVVLLALASARGGDSTKNAHASFSPTFTNSLGMEFVLIQSATFITGKSADSKLSKIEGLDYDRSASHKVTLTQPFYILENPVSEEAYKRANPGSSAIDVSWYEATAFCSWLSQHEHRNYRLPTEAEWECVFQATPDGIKMDEREWVQDWHGVIPPDDVTDPLGPATGLTKVIRDGTKRESLSPDAKNWPWGLPATRFRVVFTPEPAAHPFQSPPLFIQSAIKQSTAPVLQGPSPNIPYFTVRFALPIPPEDDFELTGPLVGIDPAVMAHQHSPGFEILPNGDALAIYFSAKDTKGGSESDVGTRFVQARLRCGAEAWDPPELFCDFKPFNDQSGLLWRDGNTLRFFGGGRGMSDRLPFKMAVSTNNGATWTMSLPLLDAPARDFTAQPITSAFRGTGDAIFFAMDAGKDASFLWRSTDNGIHWHDMGGRTGARHSTVVPLDDKGHLLSIGGKNTSIDGWSPMNTSSDWGATWSASKKSPFPALAGNQRPCLIRLANGHLCFVSDSYQRKKNSSPPGWKYGQGCFVAISIDNGESWDIKRLPVELPHESDRKFGTLGYATVRQGPNGVIHVLGTMTHPCLHYEFNEAWVISKEGVIAAESNGGTIRQFRETHPDGHVRATWSARICPNGRYLLDGTEDTYYENGNKEHEVTYKNGRKIGSETFWTIEGTKVWSWTHRAESNASTWVQYWHNGRKRLESNWNTQPSARDFKRTFYGLAANGPAYHWHQDGTPASTFNFTNGTFAGTSAPPVAQLSASANSEQSEGKP
jgi:antitoxin component YwqK of YwqJK toxin-antitoxin module